MNNRTSCRLFVDIDKAMIGLGSEKRECHGMIWNNPQSKMSTSSSEAALLFAVAVGWITLINTDTCTWSLNRVGNPLFLIFWKAEKY